MLLIWVQITAAVLAVSGGSANAQHLPPRTLFDMAVHFRTESRAGADIPPRGAPTNWQPCTDGIASSGVAIASPPPADVQSPGDKTPAQSSAGALHAPVRGTWRVVQGPPCPNLTNQHCGIPSQEYAYDFVLLNAFGQPVSCIGQSVFAPSAGTIESTLDGFPDHAVPHQHPAGNHVVIKRSAQDYILLAHFSPGTIKIKQGDTVALGQELGRCGNSGQSSIPHVHMNMQDHANPLQFSSTGKPMLLTSIHIVGPSGCTERLNHLVVQGETLCSK